MNLRDWLRDCDQSRIKSEAGPLSQAQCLNLIEEVLAARTALVQANNHKEAIYRRHLAGAPILCDHVDKWPWP
jgi:hypothetical protein